MKRFPWQLVMMMNIFSFFEPRDFTLRIWEGHMGICRREPLWKHPDRVNSVSLQSETRILCLDRGIACCASGIGRRELF